ncbi:uncharacterized protein LOC100428047 [Macaca mulatta]
MDLLHWGRAPGFASLHDAARQHRHKSLTRRLGEPGPRSKSEKRRHRTKEMLSLLSGLALLAISFLLLKLGTFCWDRNRLPPGPFPFPILGNLWQLRFQLHPETLLQLAQTHGSVFVHSVGEPDPHRGAEWLPGGEGSAGLQLGAVLRQAPHLALPGPVWRTRHRLQQKAHVVATETLLPGDASRAGPRQAGAGGAAAETGSRAGGSLPPGAHCTTCFPGPSATSQDPTGRYLGTKGSCGASPAGRSPGANSKHRRLSRTSSIAPWPRSPRPWMSLSPHSTRRTWSRW